MAVVVLTDGITEEGSATQIADLDSGDGLLVGRNATLVTTMADSVIVRAAGNARMAINGELLSNGSAIVSDDGNTVIDIGATGSITALGAVAAIQIAGGGVNAVSNAGAIASQGAAISVSGDGADITNTGMIASRDGPALDLFGAVTTIVNHGTIASSDNKAIFLHDGISSILNTGTISAVGDLAIVVQGGSGDPNRLVNTGTISSDNGVFSFAFYGEGGDDTVVNRGILLGSVALGDGEDRFNTRYGTIEGTVYGGDGDDVLFGSAEDDALEGGLDDDTLAGFAGDDSLTGNDGNDVLNGGLGADDLLGGAGTDTASYARSAMAVSASLLKPAVNRGEAAGDSYLSVENLAGSRFSDVLTGSNVANALDGAAGDDLLAGAKGNDSLTGGDGEDSFLFDTAPGAANVDAIVDFVALDDTVRIENAVFTGLVAGTLSLDAFRVGAAAADATDRIVYNKTTGELFFDKDGVGGAAAVKFATVTPNLTLAADDFFVV